MKKRKVSMNWQTKIVALIFLVVLIFFAFQLLFYLPLLERRDIERATSNQSKIAAFIAETTEVNLKRFKHRIEGLAKTVSFQYGNLEKVREIFNANVEATPLIRYLAVLDEEGAVVTGTVDRLPGNTSVYSKEDYFREPLKRGECYFSQPFYYNATDSIVVSVSVPVSMGKEDEKVVLVGGISLSNINEYVRSFCGEPECSVFLVDKTGKVFAHSRPDLLSLDYGDHPLVRDMKTGDRNRAIKQFELDNISYFGTYEKVGLNGWGVVLQQPLSVLHAETQQLGKALVVINLLFCILVLAIAVFLTRNILREQRRMQEELERSEGRFRSFVENANDIVYELSLDGIFTYVSPHWRDSVGHEAEEVVNRNFADFVYSEDVHKCKEFFHAVVTTGEKQEGVEYRVRRKDGRLRWHLSHGSPIKNEQGEVVSFLGIGRDITDRKQKEAELEELVREKDFLLDEINHRVKNNLNMINGLINLKAADSGMDLTDITNQINAISLVHEKLYQTNDVMEINVRHYLQDLLQTVFTSFSGRPVAINNTIDSDMMVPTKKAIALGLLINEIATNTVKYGIPSDKEAEFEVDLDITPETGEYVLTAANNGPPIPDHIDIKDANTLGLNVISTLADQLDGEIQLKKSPSPVFTVRFPKD